jgi:hypothetical protein
MLDTATELIARAAGVDLTLDEPRGLCTFCGQPAALPYKKAVSGNWTEHDKARIVSDDGGRYVCPACYHVIKYAGEKRLGYRLGCWIADATELREWSYADRVDWLETVLAQRGKGYQTPAVIWIMPYGARYHVAPWASVTNGTGAALVRYGHREVVVRRFEAEPLWAAVTELYLLGVSRASLMSGEYSHWDAAKGGAKLREYLPLLQHHQSSGLTPLLAECLSRSMKPEEDKK